MCDARTCDECANRGQLSVCHNSTPDLTARECSLYRHCIWGPCFGADCAQYGTCTRVRGERDKERGIGERILP